MKQVRPRSADLGGLHLATAGSGSGNGWLGYSGEMQTRFAELLTDMYNETSNAVNERDAEFAPTDLPSETRTRLIHSLDSWNFEPHKLPDEEVLACTMMLFEALFRIEHMQVSVGLSLKDQIYPLIHHLRRIYRWENTYHNFEHALDVLQCSYIFLRSAGMVPPVSILLDEDPELTWTSARKFDSGSLVTCLGMKELFVVYIAAIGHDVAHPGFTNLFMRNAETPLSMVYDGKSALEQMHCSLLLRVMRHYGLGPLLDDNCGSGGNGSTQSVRKLLSETVLATDMSVHTNFMENFKALVDDGTTQLTGEAEEGESQLWRRQVLLCQGIMKCADISNPFRPYHVSQHWAAALMDEWTSQAMLEKYMDLPCTNPCSDDPRSEADGQVFFINKFAKPLLELMVEAVPELQPHLDQCQDNLRLWQSRQVDVKPVLETAEKTTSADFLPASSSASLISTTSSFSTRRRRDDYLTAFPLALPKHHPYRNISHVDRVQYSPVGEDDRGLEKDVNSQDIVETAQECPDVDRIATSPLPRSSTSTATSATLVWPSSAIIGIDQQKDQSCLSPPSQNVALPRAQSTNEEVGKHAGRSASSSSSASASASFSNSSLSSPYESGSDISSSSVSGDSEYMSVADWNSISGESYGVASSYRTSGDGYDHITGVDRIGENPNRGRNDSISSQSQDHQFVRGHLRSITSTISSANEAANGSCSYSTTHILDPHAGLRAAAVSAQPMLRKQRSMLNRKSWGAPGEYAARSSSNDVSSSACTVALLHNTSLRPPPLSSPAVLSDGFGNQELIPSESPSARTTPKATKNLRRPTIVIAHPHSHPREIGVNLLPV
ncbi:hypothetical protein C8J55DRAFT_553636 [Lentinula edodes]|uniref:Phosphodiesterase n=1 Tax=Lentinula lateritia TaxID=40482 RepID=A0A9W9B188_9AGAR|nr:hypothetical protein C8J55DRAFT_553636 [Lentinula edodes]